MQMSEQLPFLWLHSLISSGEKESGGAGEGGGAGGGRRARDMNFLHFFTTLLHTCIHVHVLYVPTVLSDTLHLHVYVHTDFYLFF